ncbi:MAG: hypothetical protein EOO41_04435, partial [Methanobacteriota archaeon]
MQPFFLFGQGEPIVTSLTAASSSSRATRFDANAFHHDGGPPSPVRTFTTLPAATPSRSEFESAHFSSSAHAVQARPATTSTDFGQLHASSGSSAHQRLMVDDVNHPSITASTPAPPLTSALAPQMQPQASCTPPSSAANSSAISVGVQAHYAQQQRQARLRLASDAATHVDMGANSGLTSGVGRAPYSDEGCSGGNQEAGMRGAAITTHVGLLPTDSVRMGGGRAAALPPPDSTTTHFAPRLSSVGVPNLAGAAKQPAALPGPYEQRDSSRVAAGETNMSERQPPVACQAQPQPMCDSPLLFSIQSTLGLPPEQLFSLDESYLHGSWHEDGHAESAHESGAGEGSRTATPLQIPPSAPKLLHAAVLSTDPHADAYVVTEKARHAVRYGAGDSLFSTAAPRERDIEIPRR